MNYFLLRLFTFFMLFYEKTFHAYHKIFFFSDPGNYFFIVLIIIFRRITNLFFGLQYIAGLRLRGTGSSV